VSSPEADRPGRRFFIRTFGCKANQYDSQGIRESLRAAGWTEATAPGSADLLVVNSCCVTARAEATCRSAVRALRRARPGAALVLTGCAVDAGGDWVRTLPAIDHRVPNADKRRLPELLAPPPPGCGTPRLNPDPPAGAHPPPEEDPRFAFSLASFEGRTRAYVKIQDGCGGRCAYCIIPAARGRPASRPPGAILDEARRLAANGYRELVLTGINIGAWEAGGLRLPDLVARLGGVPDLARLRLGSVEPPFVTRELCAALRDTPAACPHLHIPVQHADDAVLAGMNRPTTSGELRERVALAREMLDEPAVTTDVIVGFPAETPAAFDTLLAFAGEVGFARMHVFRYSARPGTPAAALAATATEREVTERCRRMGEEAERLAAAFGERFVGRDVSVLVERSGDGELNGHTPRYVPVRAPCPGEAPREGSVVKVRAHAAGDGGLEGILADGAPAESA
jgi:threonylcarbamoyladenosine tRNA methylthiotransferase MtaB